MKKRAFSLFLAICLTLGLFAVAAPDAMAVTAGLTAEGTYGDNITWNFDEATGVLTVGGEGSMPGGYGICPDWMDFADQIVEVIILEGVTDIGYGSFRGLSALERVTLPEGVKCIDTYAFGDCKELISVIIPNTVTTIEGGAFWGCESLTRVDIPASVTSIVNTAFTRCYSLQAIFVDKGNPNYSSANGALLSKDGTELIAVPGGIEVDFEIPKSVRTIKAYAFRGCDSLTVLNIPEGVTTIEDFAFIECANLTKITFPASLTKLGAYLSGGGEDGYPNPDKTIEFAGDMPEMTIFAFNDTDVQVYYPRNNATWDGINDLQEVTWFTVTWIPYTPHEYGQWQVLKNPTYAEQGLKKRVCSDCGQEETRAIARLTAIFTDIGSADYFYSPVLWAVGEGITTGTTPTTFTPNGTATRAQVVTFLWRAMGEPEPKTGKNPFTDVKSGEYYYKAVLWAVENGITTGATTTTFNPDGACTRAQVVTFLWRNAGCPEPSTTNHPFTDLKQTEYYYDAVLWAVEEEITNGMTVTTFVPDRTCTRGQIVTFLYRDMAQ